MKELIELHGGRNLAAVSAQVDYIVAGDSMGPAKLKKAEKLGIPLLTEAEFAAMIAGGGNPAAAAEGAGSGLAAEEGPAESSVSRAGGASAAAGISADAAEEASGVAASGPAPAQGSLF